MRSAFVEKRLAVSIYKAFVGGDQARNGFEKFLGVVGYIRRGRRP